ncbi:MAG: hypothetical protein ACREDE_11140, partial [Thermoplasmata archaeon]
MSAGPAALLEREAEKRAWARASGRSDIPSNVLWRSALGPEERSRAGVAIARRPTRTLSGVAVVAVMTSPV